MIYKKKISVFLSLKIDFVLANSVDNRDEASTKKKYSSKYWVLAVLKVLK